MQGHIFSLEYGLYDYEGSKPEVLRTPQVTLFPTVQAATLFHEGISVLEGDLDFYSSSGTRLEAKFWEEPFIDFNQRFYFPGTYYLIEGQGKTLQDMVRDCLAADGSGRLKIVARSFVTVSGARKCGWSDSATMKYSTMKALGIFPDVIAQRVVLEEF